MVKITTFGRCLFIAAVVAGGMACLRPALAEDGYAGVMAAPSDDKAPAQNGAEATPGYTGVVADPSAPEPAAESSPAAEQYTPGPGRGPIQDLRTAAMIDNAPKVQAPQIDLSATQHNLIAGKPAAEYVIGKHIEQAMSSINDKNISDDQRAANAKSAYKSLSTLADGLRYKQSIPDNVYKSMGLTDDYINDERNGNAAALTELDTALISLKAYQ